MSEKNGNFQQIDGKFKQSMLLDLLYIVTADVIVFIALFSFYRNTFVTSPIIYGDSGLPNLNSSLLGTLSNPNPWFTLIFIIIFHLSFNIFGLLYNEFGLIPMLLMPATMYILLKRLGIACLQG